MDLFVLVFHLLAIFVIYNVYMFTTIILVRLPRLIFGLIQFILRRNEKNRKKALAILDIELKVRFVTTIIMFIASLIISFIFISKQFCV